MKNILTDLLPRRSYVKIIIQTHLMLFGAIIAFTSCATGTLSKTEAAKQIEELLKKGQSKCVIALQKGDCLFNDNGEHNKYMAAVANRGSEYIKFQIVKQCGMMGDQPYIKDFRLLDKAKPYLVNGSDPGITRLQFGDHLVTVTSITEPAANAQGIVVCLVTYTDALALNQFGKDIGLGMDNQNSQNTHNAQFIKMQDGWKINERYRDN